MPCGNAGAPEWNVRGSLRLPHFADVPAGNGINILLKSGENGLRNVLPGEVKIIRQSAAPDAFDDFVFGIIIVAGKVLSIEIRSFSFGRFYPDTGKH